jgi:hypothetical protein
MAARMTEIVVICLALTPACARAAEPRRQTSERRALVYLAREVPRWAAKNHCYSCHNNGDGARALYSGVKAGLPVPAKSLADTTRWLTQPEKWDHIGARAQYSDTKLARLQFAAALAAALDAGWIKERKLLKQAAQRVADKQNPDGSWEFDANGSIGSPATYGLSLATSLTRRTLQQADAKSFQQALNKADQWLPKLPVRNVFDAAAVLLGLEGAKDAAALAQREKCLALIRKGQGKDGGWGPYVNSPSEPFDSALVLLALSIQAKPQDMKGMLKRGRKYLIAVQESDGSWPATTRPAGAASYAQHISTTAWATMALLATQKR